MGNLNCFEQCQAIREHDERAKFLQAGGAFTRKKYTFGLHTGTESVHLQLHADSDEILLWTSDKQADGAKPNEIEVGDIKSVLPSGTAGFQIYSMQGEVLLELDAESAEVRSEWVTALQWICEEVRRTQELNGTQKKHPASASSLKQMVKDQANKQAYWMKRQTEMKQREKEAEERKKKVGAVGMKFTAMAMANRT
ncbi:hypothetical protein H257_00399 [Aphanomyces astaci]|uniref:PH domain-containing protein n=1 Tax=Aphanomyces astaci TaxID=112090 RepID=W4HBN3_APHAT|nr:hypothetical protein H257_00399 [Aphanomyces astaci]ETV88981.1 hypothetical protein H257_00399 [Aphanomyces astaci]RHY87160.1 hypothetical protein DYB35_001834 [Aphanomyces astaci]RHZ06668.1 hypothetical protein DYB37_002776 [Aphanomyces astaci]RQM19859.1 hypothetical protein B5M09_000634 [Aphanomyces astaci]|eukprot:XP_009821381.1 hypothetical protein H257_00399 [Aphanomyces astaci]